MILKFKYGFEYEGFLYGWNNKELYRLPSTSGNKSYGLKKLDSIVVGNSVGYRIKQQKFSINQLKNRTIFIDKEYQVIKNEVDIP
jgi:hypothetical protein